MESLLKHSKILTHEAQKTLSPIQVLQVHKASISDEDQDEDYLPDGIYVCHAPLIQALKQISTQSKFIDAVIAGPDCTLTDIEAIKEVTTEKLMPLILHTLKFDWKTKEVALECGVDEYHVGYLDDRFVKRVRLIKKIKLMNSNPSHRLLLQRSDWKPIVKFWLLKRSFDIAASLLIIGILSPLLLIIVPMLMLDTKGSILSSSKRVGRNYKIFSLYKFRYFPVGVDRKITGIWKLLHKTHLVGLPQILNVLKGDMSIVGNYPVLPHDAEKLTKDGIVSRFLVPVGIIGLWRLNTAENKTEVWDCTRLDVEYAISNSILLDAQILCFHFLNLLDRRGKAWVCHNLPMWNQKFQSATN